MCYNEKHNSTKNFEFYFCRAGGGMEIIMNEKQNAKKRMKELEELINHHARLYYISDAPTISDYEYDKLFYELVALEEKYPELARRVTSFEYDSVLKRASELGFDGYTQGADSATSAFTPDFE